MAQSQQSGRQRISSGSPYEAQYGYSRAVRVGSTIHVAGTTGTGPDGKVAEPGDAYAQAKRALATIERALGEAGASLQDVVRTRIFVTDMQHAEAVLRAHGEAFGSVRPATSLIGVQALIDPAMLVEIEAYAVVDG